MLKSNRYEDSASNTFGALAEAFALMNFAASGMDAKSKTICNDLLAQGSSRHSGRCNELSGGSARLTTLPSHRQGILQVFPS